MGKLVIYGAYGYTGRLIAGEAKNKGLNPVLSGRNEDKLKEFASSIGFEAVPSGLGKGEIDEVLKDADVVIHAAGPFVHTARPMLEACLRTKTHYLDITGEIEVFEMCAQFDEQAKNSGIMVIPGSGFDVVPSDCLAKYLSQKLPDATKLELAFTTKGGGLSRGTAMTIVENLGSGGAVREDHKIRVVPTAHKTKVINFGDFKTLCVAIPWGDVSTSYYSTGIPNIEVYTGANKSMVRSMKFSNYIGWFLRSGMAKNFARKKIDSRPSGPSDKARAKSKSYLWGRVSNDSGDSKMAWLTAPEGYTLTALTSVACAQKIFSGNVKTGFRTPSQAFGADFILEIPGCERRDIE